MNKEEIIQALKKLNFTEYEAKIYISLLELHPQNGNAISKLSGVPNSKVYETLHKMLEKGYVVQLATGKKSNIKKYSPKPYKSLIEETEDQFTDNINFINKSFDKLAKSWDQNYHELFSIEGYDSMMEILKNEIENASTEIMMNCWDNELQSLLPTLQDAHERNVRILTVTFDTCSTEVPWKHFNHAQTEHSSESHNGELTAVIDVKRAIVFEGGVERPTAVISSHGSTINVLKNYITHDIYLSHIYADLEKEIKSLYGDDLEKLYESIK